MEPRIVKAQAARWQVIVPWQRGDILSEVVAAEVTVLGNEVTVLMIGSKQPITFPLERVKLFLAALTEAVATCEAANDSSPKPVAVANPAT